MNDFSHIDQSLISLGKIGFIVQGPIYPTTAVLCKQIKHHYPDSALVLSTWKGQDISNIEADKFVLLDDPGSDLIVYNNNIVNKENTNRQYISTREGIINCDAEIIFKLRTDYRFVKKANFDEINRCITQNKVIIVNVNTVDPLSSLKYIGHVSDWIYVGKRSVMLEIFSSEKIPNDYFVQRDNSNMNKNGFNFGSFTAEQLMFKQYFDSIAKFDTSKFYSDSIYTRLRYLIHLTSNFEIYKLQDLGLEFDKYRKFYRPTFIDFKVYLGTWSFTISPYCFLLYKKMIKRELNIFEKMILEFKASINALAKSK